MLKQDFLTFVTSIWQSAYLAHVLGHSFRIGGAVELLLAGVAPEIVAATGGWTSLAFLIYWSLASDGGDLAHEYVKGLQDEPHHRTGIYFGGVSYCS